MAIKLSDEFPGQSVAPSSEYPQGSAQNITTPGDGTGTPWIAKIVNNWEGFFQSLLDIAGFTPTGSPDEVGASQYFDALPIAIEPADNFRLFNRWMADRIQYVALQGAAESYPENTIPAILAAKGMTGVFLEARLTSDNEWIIIKDSTVDRTTDGTGDVDTKSLAAIQALDAGAWKNAYFAGTRIPTLEQALLATRKVKLHPIISPQIVASDTYRQTLIDACVKFSDGYNFTITVAGAIDEVSELQAYRALDKRVNLMLPVLTTVAQGLIDLATMQPAVADLGNIVITAANIKSYHDAGFNTIDSGIDPIDLETSLEKGFGGIISNAGELIGVEL